MGRIDWLPIADCPDALKDGRDLLLWDGAACVGHWFDAKWLDSRDGIEILGVSDFAELNEPS